MVVLFAGALVAAGRVDAQRARRFDPAREHMQLVAVKNGFGQLLPHRVPVPDGEGLPTLEVVGIRGQEDLANVRVSNPILPPVAWPSTAVLPDGRPGNHYLFARFSHGIEVASVLTDLVSAADTDNLSGSVRVVAFDPATRSFELIRGRVFIGGKTYGSIDPVDPARLRWERWVELDDLGRPRARTIAGARPGLGFPGTQSHAGYPDAQALLEADTLVFVVDSDDDLSTHETFPSGVQIQMRIHPGVRSLLGDEAELEALASSAVGADGIPPDVLGFPSPAVEPPDGAIEVDPATHVFVTYNEPVQPFSVGVLEVLGPPALSTAIQLEFGPAAARVSVPFHVRFRSVFDLSRVELVPAYPFPGSSGGGVSCGVFGQVDVRFQQDQVADLLGNRNELALQTSFVTAEGPGLVNAPVTPDAIYVARAGGLSVIDLNGFGQGTGNPTFDSLHPIVQGNSNFPNNPNVWLNGSLLIPPLAPGTCTFDGGSSGPFTLTKDSALGDHLVGPPLVESVGDMALGHALDGTFNDGQPFGCQAGGGNLCAATGLKRITLAAGGVFTVAPTTVTGLPPLRIGFGIENLASWSPHPNPPPLVYPPLCLMPLIGGQEPTAIDATYPPPPDTGFSRYGPPYPARSGPGLGNLLAPGPFPLGIPELDLPPQGTLARELNAFFEGPATAQPQISLCSPFMMRQQVGQFLYVVDRLAGEIVVLNSNRFTVIDRIPLPDPTSLAMSPNLDLLAVSNESADQVAFIDVDPSSPDFHDVVQVTEVGDGPLGIAWDPGNEDILVCNRGDGTVSVISAFTLEVRKVVQAHGKVRGVDGSYTPGHRPLDVVLTPRQLGFAFARGVYFGYILNTDGTLSIFESGPDGINGWGYDDIVATLPFRLWRARTLQPDPTDLLSSVFVVHERPLGLDGRPTGQAGGALTRIGIVAALPGIRPLGADATAPPHLRFMEFGVHDSLGEGPAGLSGVPVDLAFDDQLNLSALNNFSTQFSASSPLAFNGKSIVRQGPILAASAPAFLFLAVPGATIDSGRVDVIGLDSRERADTDPFQAGIQSIPVPGVSGLMNYFRQ